MSLEDDLLELKSYQAFSSILEGDTLLPLQAVDTLKLLFRQHGILMYDTGMGKTFIACALCKALMNQDPSVHVIMFVKNKQLAQTPKKMEKLLGYPVLGCTGQEKDLQEKLASGKFKSYPVVLIAHSCLHNNLFVEIMAQNRGWFQAVIIDEAHSLCNYNEGQSGAVLASLCKNVFYSWALTATPMTSSLLQCAKLATILDPLNYPNTQKLVTRLRNGKFNIRMDPCFWISRSRKDFGVIEMIRGHAIPVKPMPHQFKAAPADLLRLCKGKGAENQAIALADFIVKQRSKGLVYINEHATRNWVIPYLEARNIRYACVNGNTKPQDTEEILYNFNELGLYDVLITSVTEALDLECDWVMFYEFTVNVQQMIGRAYRGFANKCLDVYFMVTLEVGEIEWFKEHILTRANTINAKLDKRYDAVYQAANEMTALQREAM